MVQLRGFRYLESDQSTGRLEMSLNEPDRPGQEHNQDEDQRRQYSHLEANQNQHQHQQVETTNRNDNSDDRNDFQDQKPIEETTTDRTRSTTNTTNTNGSASSASSSTLIGGGNLIGATSTTTSSPNDDDGSQTLSSSNDEFQEARLEMADDDDDDDDDDDNVNNDTRSSSSSSGPSGIIISTRPRDPDTTTDSSDNKENPKHTPATATTTIHIKSKREIDQDAAGADENDGFDEDHQTPNLPRLRLYQPKGVVTDGVQAGRPQTPQVRPMSPAMPQSKARFGQLSNPNISGDNMSQYSLGQLRSASHFEIRWQNIRLVARRSKWPRFVTDNPVYRLLYGDQADSDDPLKSGSSMCYSPPIQHKIPPTICEEADHGAHQVLAATKHSKSASSSSSSSSSSSCPPAQVPPVISSTDDVVIPVGSSKLREQQQQPANEGGSRCILDGISGSVVSGQITAVLGPSGVGKTTLLNSLTGRNMLDGTGRVRLMGAAGRKRISVVTVPQVDVLPGKLTTMEDLLFTSRLKNPQSGFDHRRNIERLVKHLHMEKFVHARIDKLSGGEERRLSIARELLSSPDIMILDEPTSGLDANTCKKIIMALRDIVEHSDYILDKPMSIIITIHQPQQEVYNLFHRVYVMAVGGRAIYAGPPDLLLPSLLERSSLARTTPVEQLNENPAIVAIEVASGEYGPAIIDELAKNHESQMYEEFCSFADPDGAGPAPFGQSPMATPLSIHRNSGVLSRKWPLATSVSPRIDTFHRKRLNSTDSSLGRPTPSLLRKNFSTGSQLDKMSAVTSVSYASTYDVDLPEQVAPRLKVDKRLRRSVVMKSDLFSHTYTLMQRCWLLSTRDMFLMAIRVIGFLLVAQGTVQIFSGAIDPNQHQCPQYESEVDDVIGFMESTRSRLEGLLPMLRQANSNHLFFFHLLLCTTMVTSALAGLVFPIQMRMFMREYKNGWYSPGSFVISQTLAELPIDMIGPTLTLIIAYPLCNQPTSAYYWREIGYILIFIVSSIICKAQAQFVGAILMDSVEMSVFMSCVAVTFPALLSGIPIRVSQMTTPLQLASYLSFLRYAFEGLMSIRYGYGMCPCDPELIYGYPTNATNVALPENLNNMARGFLELNNANYTGTSTPSPNTALQAGANNELVLSPLQAADEMQMESLFLRFIRLMTNANNLFVDNAPDLGNCNQYRSLYLMSIDVPNNQLPAWTAVLLLMFVVSRILIYFVVKTVIKLRR